MLTVLYNVTIIMSIVYKITFTVALILKWTETLLGMDVTCTIVGYKTVVFFSAHIVVDNE